MTFLRNGTITGFILGLLLLGPCPGSGQEKTKNPELDSTSENAQPDSTLPHSVSKATWLSAALPGAGQFYNEKYWKIPIIYAGLGAVTYFAVENNRQYQKFLSAFLTRVDGDSSTVDQFVDIYPETSQLIELQDLYRRWRDLSIIIGVAVYALNILDAHVDAHLYDFNVNQDLSFRLEPAVLRQNALYAVGFNFTIRWQ